MTARELAEAYLGALGRADLTAMLSLFSEGAVVHSPLYGPVPACEFFPALFGLIFWFLAIISPGTFGPSYFIEVAAVIAASAGGPPDLEAIGEGMRRHGLTPALPG